MPDTKKRPKLADIRSFKNLEDYAEAEIEATDDDKRKATFVRLRDAAIECRRANAGRLGIGSP